MILIFTIWFSIITGISFAQDLKCPGLTRQQKDDLCHCSSCPSVSCHPEPTEFPINCVILCRNSDKYICCSLSTSVEWVNDSSCPVITLAPTTPIQTTQAILTSTLPTDTQTTIASTSSKATQTTIMMTSPIPPLINTTSASTVTMTTLTSISITSTVLSNSTSPSLVPNKGGKRSFNHIYWAVPLSVAVIAIIIVIVYGVYYTRKTKSWKVNPI